VCKYKDGSEYSGHWKKDKMHGFGKFKMADGSCYEGEFQDDVSHGKGKLTEANGTVVTGVWANGELQKTQE
jgi:hypothetical protein